MATNVTEKDKTLHTIIDFCEALSLKIKCSEDVSTDRTYGKLRGIWLVEKQMIACFSAMYATKAGSCATGDALT